MTAVRHGLGGLAHEYNPSRCTGCTGTAEADPPDALLRVLLAAGEVWGFRRVADIAVRLAATKDPS